MINRFPRCVIIAVSLLALCFSISTSVRAQEKAPAADVKKEKQDVNKSGGVGAEKNKEAQPKIFSFDLGLKGSFAEGSTPASMYYQPFFNCYVKNKYVKFTGGLSRVWDYQITNDRNDYETVNFTQPKVALSVYPHRVIEIYGEYRYSSGDKSHYYRSNYGATGVQLDFESVAFGGYVSYATSKYHFKSDDTKDNLLLVHDYQDNPTPIRLWWDYRLYEKRKINHTDEFTASPEFSWFVHETTSIDLSYEHKKTEYQYPNSTDTYKINTFRIGVSSQPWKYFSFMTGFSNGWDSGGYIIPGGYLGVIFNILDYVKISSTYSPSYYLTSRMNPELKKLLDAWAMYQLGTRRNVNPYLQLSKIGKSFWNQAVNFSVAYQY